MQLGAGRYLMGWVAAASIGTSGTAMAQDEWNDVPLEIHGFTEAAFGSRVTADPLQPNDFLLGEVRFRLDLSHFSDAAWMSVKTDLIADGISESVDIDIREALVALPVAEWLDVRAGRQVLTWGTGDFVFLNDLFSKDFVSFFIGRDDEFLKAPSNSVKLTFYSTLANVDLVWTPLFEPDRFITGERLTFFDRSVPALVSEITMGGRLESVRPAKELGNGELAARVFRTIGGYEFALYGYVGFTKQPLAFDATRDLPTHSRMAAPGASVRGNLLGGVANAEGVYYVSEDKDGSDAAIPNSEIRTLMGYERELFGNFTLGLQYYVEWIQNYDRLIVNSPAPEFEPEEVHHTITTRLTSLLRQQTLTLSLFAFVSPSDGDAHLRPTMSLKPSDAVTISAGANIMLGGESTFFGQLETNSNAYLRLRYSF